MMSSSRSTATMRLLLAAVRSKRHLVTRSYSSPAAALQEKPPSPSPPPVTPAFVPTRHSRKKLPLVCTDPAQLGDLTAQLLETSVGSLFQYQGKHEAEDAWDVADATVQKAEFVLRGHAWTLPGTQWHRWLVKQNWIESADPNATLETMEALVDRMWEEGYSYMTVRASRLEELAAADGDEEEELELEAFLEGEQSEEVEVQVMEELSDITGGKEAQMLLDNGGSHMEDFALPGPTTHMFDILLDSMACTPKAEFVSPQAAFHILEDIIGRHKIDGGDGMNCNVHSMPTAMSYNAALRVAAEAHYDVSNKSPANVRHRDEALRLALGAFDAMSQSAIELNCATYTYLLMAITKYFPASRIRGNIAHGMFHHAKIQGLIDQGVLVAYRAANTPSNGAEFDDWIQGTLDGSSLQDLPMKWRRNNSHRRHHPREAIY